MLLHQHNSETYANMVRLFETEHRVAAVQPTGTGKSYLIMQLIEDNPDKLFAVCSPSTYIFEQMKVLADKNSIPLDNVNFITYARLMQTELIDSFDYIVLDEFHRCGAVEWGRGVQDLLDANTQAKIFGTSATPIRYLDSGRNMADEIFGGVYAVNMTLAEAINLKILPLPIYVTSWYSFRGDIEQLEIKAEQSGNPRLKNVLLGKIRKAKSMIAELDVGIEKIFEKHIPDKNGKYIVFCPNVEELGRIVTECDLWFAKVNHDIHKYKVYSQNAGSEKQFEEFKADKDDSALKLLFCIDMLNEGVHFDDVAGVVMLRATQSANVFYQQLGRALACSDAKTKPVIFDVVNNFETGDVAQQYAGIMEIARNDENYYDDEIEFELYDYVRDIREILNELNDTFANSWDLNFELLNEYVEKIGRFPGGNTSYEGVSIGKWCITQRVLNNQGKLSEDRKDKLNSIDFPWNINEESWMAAYNEFARLTEKLGHFPLKDEMPKGKKDLFNWLNIQRRHYRSGTLAPQRAQMLINLGCNMTVLSISQWEERYEQLKDFIDKNGRLPNYSDRKKSTLCNVLCTWINTQRGSYVKGTITPEHKAALDEINFPWSKRDVQWNMYFDILKQYYIEHKTLPKAKTVVDGVRISTWYNNQVRFYRDGTMPPERRARFENEGIPVVFPGEQHKVETWMRYYDSYVEYLDKFHKHPSSTERYHDLEIRKWWYLQKRMQQQGKLSVEQVEMLTNIGIAPAAT